MDRFPKAGDLVELADDNDPGIVLEVSKSLYHHGAYRVRIYFLSGLKWDSTVFSGEVSRWKLWSEC